MPPRINDLARDRENFNRGSRTNRPLTSTAEVDGIAGEIAMAALLGRVGYRPPTGKRTPGYQLVHQDVIRIKVLTSRKPFRLLVKEGKVAASLYVLAGIRGEPEAHNVWFVGWADSSMVKRAPTEIVTRKDGKPTTDYELPSHTIARAKLRPMIELAQILGFDPENLQLAAKEREDEPAQKETTPSDSAGQTRLF